MWSRTRRAIWCLQGDPQLDRIYMGLGYPDPALICLSKEGEMLWKCDMDRPPKIIKIYSSSRNILVFLKKKKLPPTLLCISNKGELLWRQYLKYDLKSIDITDNGKIIVLGTVNSTVLLLEERGEIQFRIQPEKWINGITAHFFDRDIMAVSDRGFLYVMETYRNRLNIKEKVDLENNVSLMKKQNDRLAFLDQCAKTGNILHLYNWEGNSYLNIKYKKRIKNFSYAGNRIWSVLDNSIICLFDENQGFRTGLDMGERIYDITTDYYGGYIVVGTENFKVLLMDRSGQMIWGMDTRGKKLAANYAEKTFKRMRESELISEDEGLDCYAHNTLISSIEKNFIDIPVEKEEDGDDGWITDGEEIEDGWLVDDDKLAGRRKLLSGFKPTPVKRKVTIKSQMAMIKQRPSLLVHIENTTSKSITNIKVDITMDKTLFSYRKNLTQLPVVTPNTAKRMIIPMISKSEEGSCIVSGTISYNYQGKERTEDLAEFKLVNRWKKLEGLIIKEDSWNNFIHGMNETQDELFTSLTPPYLGPLMETIATKHGFKEYKIEKIDDDLMIYFAAQAKNRHYGLKNVIRPSSLERGVCVIKIFLYGTDPNLVRLKDMLINELEDAICFEEDTLHGDEDIPQVVIKDTKRKETAEKLREISISDGKDYGKDETDVPVWYPEAAPAPKYSPKSLPIDYGLYKKYSEYYKDYFVPYPEKKDALSVVPRKGYIYLFKEQTPDRAFRIFKAMINYNLEGLFISRKYPNNIVDKYSLGGIPYLWLSKTGEKNAIRPTATEKIRHELEKFLNNKKNKGNSVVLFEGIEYLVIHNTFNTVIKFLQSLKDWVSLSNGTLLLCIGPSTLETRELMMIEKECDEIIS